MSITDVNDMSISDAEAKVMEALWHQSPQTADELFARISDEQDWQLTTLKTLLNRLLNKGVIAADKDGRRFLYRPLLQREHYVAEQSQSLIDRLFSGKLAPLVAQFSARGKLSAADVAELKSLIDKMEQP